MNNDLISREALKDAIYERPESEGNARAAQLLEAIIKAPAVDAEPVRRGSWENVRNRTAKTYLRSCSACGKECYFCGIGCSYKYCPNCGAKMDGDRDE